MNKALCTATYLTILASIFNPAIADLFIGSFIAKIDGKTYRLSIEPANSKGYDGVFMIDKEAMEVDARRFGDQLAGRIISKHSSFGFRAEMQGSAPLVRTETGLVLPFRRDY